MPSTGDGGDDANSRAANSAARGDPSLPNQSLDDAAECLAPMDFTADVDADPDVC